MAGWDAEQLAQEAGTEPILTAKSNVMYVFFDLESATTGRKGTRTGICQLGMHVPGSNGKAARPGSRHDAPTPTLCMLVNPGPKVRFDDICVDVHGITKADVADADDFPTVWATFMKWLEKWRRCKGRLPGGGAQGPRDVVLVAHNGKVCALLRAGWHLGCLIR